MASSWRSALGVAVAAFFLAAAALKFAPVHAGIFLVPTRSMVPTIEPGDLVVVAGSHFKVGDIVVWCIGHFRCIVHRVVAVGNGTITTKGDANPIPDRPVPISSVKGRVVAVVPRTLWIPLVAAALLAAYLPDLASILRRGEAPPAVLAAGVVAAYLAVALLVPLLSTSMSMAVVGYVRQPTIYLSKAYFNSSDCSVHITYYSPRVGGLRILKLLRVEVNGVATDSYFYAGDTLIVYPGPRVVAEAVERDSGWLDVGLEAALTGGARLLGHYRVHIDYKPLRIHGGGGVLVLENPNCYPINVTVRILYSPAPAHPWLSYNITMPLTGRQVIVAPNVPYVYADVEYTVSGSRMHWRVRLRP